MAETSQTKTDAHKKAMLEALKSSLGNVTHACKEAGISRSQFYKWINEDPAFAASCEEVKDVALDFAESALLKQIKEGNVTAIIFYLKTQGKQRGYVERMEATGENGKSIEVIVRPVSKGDRAS